ncbi:MAG: TonB-dependent receptor plug domain-containing protein [Gammaproteobacteria bacterium]
MSQRMAWMAMCVLVSALSSNVQATDQTALDALTAAAHAARIAAEAAQAAADAASVAADAAHTALSGTATRAAPASAPEFQAVNPFVQEAVEQLQSTPARDNRSASTRPDSPAHGTRVFSRADIEQSGDITVADFLRRQSSNIGGSLAPTIGRTATAAALINTRALGAERTVVLINGRRLASTVLGDGTLANNLTTLPLAAIERIEILPDGQSARFGEDAVGGAINLITRESFEGLHASAGLSETRDGVEINEHYAVVAGVDGEFARVMIALDGASQKVPDRLGGQIDDANLNRDSAHVQAGVQLGRSLEVYAEATAGRAQAMSERSSAILASEEFGQATGGVRITTDRLGGIALDASSTQSLARNATTDVATDNAVRLDTLHAKIDFNGLRLPGVHLPVFVGGEQRQLRVDGRFNTQRDIESLFGGAGLHLLDVLKLDYWQREDRFGVHADALRSQRYAASLALLPGLRVHGAYASGYSLASLGETAGGISIDPVTALDYALCEKLNPGALALDAGGRPTVVDGNAFPANSACRPQTYNALTRANLPLSPERSEHWRAGLTFRANPIALSLSAYRIEIDAITRAPDADATLAQEWLLGVSDLVLRNGENRIDSLLLTSRNAGRLHTQGAEAEFLLGSYLNTDMPFGVRVVANYIDEFLETSLDELAPTAAPNLLLPRLRTSVDLRYAPIKQATLLLSANFIDEAATPDRRQLIEEWFTLDAQLSLQLPWRGALTFGVRNLLNQTPPAAFGFEAPYYNNQRYGALGFAPYLTYRQSL